MIGTHTTGGGVGDKSEGEAAAGPVLNAHRQEPTAGLVSMGEGGDAHGRLQAVR